VAQSLEWVKTLQVPLTGQKKKLVLPNNEKTTDRMPTNGIHGSISTTGI
jgi:hypothetical protein